MKFRLTSILLLSLSSTVIAQHSYKAEVMPQRIIPYNWTGYYAGVNVGFVNHIMTITDTNASSFNATLIQETNPKWAGGLQIGYRKQTDLTIASGVYGAELSANFSNAKFSKEYGAPFALYQIDSHHQLKNVILLELIGGLAANRTLLFLAVGASWINVTGSNINVSGSPFFDTFSVDKKQFGAAIGAGVEYAFTDQISARAKLDVIRTNVYSTTDNVDNSYSISNHIVQGAIGLNYRFMC